MKVSSRIGFGLILGATLAATAAYSKNEEPSKFCPDLMTELTVDEVKPRDPNAKVSIIYGPRIRLRSADAFSKRYYVFYQPGFEIMAVPVLEDFWSPEDAAATFGFDLTKPLGYVFVMADPRPIVFIPPARADIKEEGDEEDPLAPTSDAPQVNSSVGEQEYELSLALAKQLDIVNLDRPDLKPRLVDLNMDTQASEAQIDRIENPPMPRATPTLLIQEASKPVAPIRLQPLPRPRPTPRPAPVIVRPTAAIVSRKPSSPPRRKRADFIGPKAPAKQRQPTPKFESSPELDERGRKIVELWKEHLSPEQIANRLGCSTFVVEKRITQYQRDGHLEVTFNPDRVR